MTDRQDLANQITPFYKVKNSIQNCQENHNNNLNFLSEKQELIIDKEFHKLIPQLKDNEYKDLETSILAEGIRDKLIIWKNILIDGHNRYEIAQKHNKEFETHEMTFQSRDEAKIWIIDNACARRNLADYERYELKAKKQKLLGKTGKDKRKEEGKKYGRGHKKNLLLDSNKRIKHDTRKQIAKELGWSSSKLARADVVRKKGNDEQKAKLRKGDMTIDRAYRDIKKEEKKEKREEENKELEGKYDNHIINDNIKLICGDFKEKSKDIEDNSVDCIITDPPYPKEYLDLWEELSKLASRVLKPSGFLITYSGKLHLDEVFFNVLKTQNIKYYWQMILLHSGPSAGVHPRKINTQYKPILIFQKEPIKPQSEYMSDLIKGTGREKDLHEWQQAEEELNPLINNFTKINDLILDPMCGSGTVIMAGYKLKRRVIGIDIEQNNINKIYKRINSE